MSKDDKQKQDSLFGGSKFDKEWWENDWQGMPEYVQKDIMPWKTLYVHFQNQEDRDDFENLVEQKLTDLTKSIWYPEFQSKKPSNYKYIDEL